jgi:hypothetical protein
MSYSIHLRINQKGTDFYGIVEQTVWSSGVWTNVNGETVLTMDGSGTSGTLRFKCTSGICVLFAMGVHNYKRWCDIVTDLQPKDTGTTIQPTYYQDPGVAGNRNDMLWKQLPTLQKTDAKGNSFSINFFKEDGNTLYAEIDLAC